MLLDPTKLKLKPPGSKRSTPNCDENAFKLCFQIHLAPLHRGCGRGRRPHGRALQVDPINPSLEAPGIKRSNLKYDKLLSNFAFKLCVQFHLRRYSMVADKKNSFSIADMWAGAYTRRLFIST